MYINGEWKDTSNKEKRNIINPPTGEVFAQAAEGTIQDAKVVFDHGNGIWPRLPAVERAAYLFHIADKIDQYAAELVKLETMDNGKTIREASGDIGDAAACFRYYAGLITAPDGQTYHVADPMQAMVVREPVGVCGLIVPWNYPLLMSVWKLAPAGEHITDSNR